jgi:site-specific recombinase XerD
MAGYKCCYEKISMRIYKRNQRYAVFNYFNKKQSLEELINAFFDSNEFKRLAESTRNDYTKNARNILAHFKRTPSNKIKAPDVRKYLDMRCARSLVQANREKAFLSRLYKWGFERGLVDHNPCYGVRNFKESPRDKYIEDFEYMLVYKHACPAVRTAMEISYLCAARESDVLKLTWSNCLYEGLFIQQGKTGKKQIKRWSIRLALTMIDAQKDGIASNFIVHKKDGNSYSQRGFWGKFAEARKMARKMSGEPLEFTFHDIKAKGISDFNGSLSDKQRFSGHKSLSQVSVYDRKIEVVDSLFS